MDTVIGSVGGKAIMTMDFTFFNFVHGFLLDGKSAAALSEKVKELKGSLAGIGVSFGDIIPLALTDNGGEFSDVLPLRTMRTARTRLLCISATNLGSIVGSSFPINLILKSNFC